MRTPLASVLIVVTLAAGLWVIPSVGTRGQGTVGHGTLGDRFVHADRAIIADTQAGQPAHAGTAMLNRADRQLAEAVAAL